MNPFSNLPPLPSSPCVSLGPSSRHRRHTQPPRRQQDLFIRHGENTPGLDAPGQQRAACLAKLFPSYNLNNLFCPDYNKNTQAHERACLTLTPLSKKINVPLDHPFATDDAHGIAGAIKKAATKGNVLVAWEHKDLADIVGPR
ncbi:Aste57867_20850 [Aphanomyces stellatus]|uniref:Aste57867_20850 protein n=1 Tax=Aphanomyces stellatus TaxID=120398 RepID=A0A485LGQ2_9STRA|nr:hypothetical protein As57867_020782 [Aphanomyces stellatus]VFT97528.1 Aste57867_20850 [Aphanomyces stellatus]